MVDTQTPRVRRPKVLPDDEAPHRSVRRRLTPRRRGIDRATIDGWLGVGRPFAHRMLQSRRRLLLTLGGGAAAVAGLGSAAAAAFGTPAEHAPGGAGTDRYTAGLGDDLGATGVADTPAQAAAAALKATPRFPNPLSRDPALHLLRRVTFGVSAADLTAVRKVGIDAWIDQQLAPESIPDPGGDAVVAAFPTIPMSTAQLRALPDGTKLNAQAELGYATIGRQMFSSRQLFEQMVDFWANHLNVNSPLDGGRDIRSVYDRDVIRAHALGRFADMLHASARAPAMLRRLNNDQSDRRNVNENYGREILELHTVGAASGYTEHDIRQSAYILTGRTIDRNGEFVYEAYRHYTGRVKVLGFSHANKSAAGGLAVGDEYVRYLAHHEATAHTIARKLCIRFVCDNPPPLLVMRLAREYLANDTAIVPVLRLLFRSLEFWVATGLKTKRPLENMVSTARVLGVEPGEGAAMANALQGMYYQARRFGQAPLAYVPPTGYADVAGAWSSEHIMLSNWNTHRLLVMGAFRGLRYPRIDKLVPKMPSTTGGYLDALADRLLFQPLTAKQRKALLTFLDAGDGGRKPTATLGYRINHVVALLLDSAYHALR